MMKLLSLFILSMLFINFSSGQQLTVSQTVDYLNKIMFSSYNGNSIILQSDGNITYQNRYSFNFNDVELSNYSSIPAVRVICSGDKMMPPVMRPQCIKCLKGCGIGWADKTTSFFDMPSEDAYTTTKVYNAFSYLFSLLATDATFVRDKDDPFAPNNYNPNSTSIQGNAKTSEIQLVKKNGVFEIWISINGIKKKFILDSGASDVAISKDEEQDLISDGILKKEFYIEPALYKIADGSIISCRRFILPELTVGNFTVKNIRVSVGINNTPLLLGKSFLDKFSKWTINNISNKLILEK